MSFTKQTEETIQVCLGVAKIRPKHAVHYYLQQEKQPENQNHKICLCDVK